MPNELATQLLANVDGGHPFDAREMEPLLYPQLRDMAARALSRHGRGRTWQPTDLVHEAFAALIDHTSIGFRGRTHFFAYAGGVMRNILRDHAKSRFAQKRGGGRAPIELSVDPAVDSPALQFLELDEALNELERRDPRQGKVVELRFFSGLEEKEIAEVLGVSERTIQRLWRFARLWLAERLAND